MTVQTAIRQGTKLLDEAAVADPKQTAELLLCHALRKERVFLFAHPEHELSELAWLHYGRYLNERSRGKPTQYITHKQEFHGREFRVSAAVLIPRPETEIVVEEALRWCVPGARAVDVGLGSGAIAVTLALESKNAVIFGVEVSRDALQVARENALAHDASVRMLQADLLTAFKPASFDVIVSNPPYIKNRDREGMQREVRDFEPAIALFAGDTGTESYQRLFEQARRVLRPGGRLVLELGYDSLDAVQLLAADCCDEVLIRDDLAGIPRVFSARLRP